MFWLLVVSSEGVALGATLGVECSSSECVIPHLVPQKENMKEMPSLSQMGVRNLPLSLNIRGLLA